MNAPEQFHMDLIGDLKILYNSSLMELGYPDQINDDVETLGMKFANALRRRLQVKPRRFREPKIMSIPTEVSAGYYAFVKKVERGDDLSPHLSTRIEDAGYNDPLLNSFNIFHFHLGEELHPQKANFVKRTRVLLFAMVTDSDFYALEILPHDHPDAFFRQEFIDVLHENWSSELKHLQYVGATCAEPRPSNKDFKLLRDNGINTFLRSMDGTIYKGGFGVTSAGGKSKHFGVRAVGDAVKIVKSVNSLESLIRAKFSTLDDFLHRNGGCTPYKFSLVILNNEPVVLETSSGFMFRRGFQKVDASVEEKLVMWRS